MLDFRQKHEEMATKAPDAGTSGPHITSDLNGSLSLSGHLDRRDPQTVCAT